MRRIIKCLGCGKKAEHRAKGHCSICYKKYIWKRKKKICPRCKRLRPIHAKGYCGGCYQTLFHLEKAKANNYKNTHNLNVETYRRLTKKCVICGFNKMVDLHHLDENNENNELSNFVALCPNHHRMIHILEHKNEVLNLLKEKGIKF